jgi:hypothetical protein
MLEGQNSWARSFGCALRRNYAQEVFIDRELFPTIDNVQQGQRELELLSGLGAAPAPASSPKYCKRAVLKTPVSDP